MAAPAEHSVRLQTTPTVKSTQPTVRLRFIASFMNTPARLRSSACLLLALAASPFAASASAAESAPAPLLRSVLIDGDTRLFSLADATGAGTWVKLGASFGDWKLESFDVATQTLTVSQNGVTKR